jgi:hypothetical protein
MHRANDIVNTVLITLSHDITQHNINAANKDFENIAMLKHFGKTLTKLHSQENEKLLKFWECLLP